MTNRLFFSLTALALATALSLSVSCKKEKSSDADSFNVSGVVLPATLEAVRGGTVTLTVLGGHGPAKGDLVVFENVSSERFSCGIISVASDGFTFSLDERISSGNYTVYIQRGDLVKKVGKTLLNVVSSAEVDPDDATIYGVVSSADGPVEGVVVSDGFDVAVTDHNGIYRLVSAKDLGYVFISVPSGYEVMQKGVLPLFHQYLSSAASVPERHDFSLIKTDNDNYTLFVFGDMHAANRSITATLTEFSKFTSDVRSYMDSHSGEKFYAVTLGDMTWDAYWTSTSYCFTEYLADMNAKLSDLPVFHTIGNHDHDLNQYGDILSEVKYVRDVCPTYYSFNLGKTHYVVLDDIQYPTKEEAGSTPARDAYSAKVNAEQMAWLRKDISHVPTSMSIVVCTHAPVYRESSAAGYSMSLNGGSSLISTFSSFSDVQFLTGHTHKVVNVDMGTHFEHNSGAVCATWWWSTVYNGSNKIHIATDGAPGGYAIWDVKGTDKKWKFKGIKEDPSYQFRSYDLNKVDFTAAGMTSVYGNSAKAEAFAAAFPAYGQSYSGGSNNYILLNVWNWDPSWTIEVKEKKSTGDVALTQQRLLNYDPLHILAYVAQRYVADGNNSFSFQTSATNHLFRFKASAPDTTVEIKVTDRFGNVYTETMQRPKPFTVADYATGYAH